VTHGVTSGAGGGVGENGLGEGQALVQARRADMGLSKIKMMIPHFPVHSVSVSHHTARRGRGQSVEVA
jgi:hypothetical protein